MPSFWENVDDFTSNAFGLAPDKANLIASQLISIVFAFIFYFGFSHKNVGTNARHVYSLSVGMFLAFCCFRWQIIQLIASAVISYILLRLRVSHFQILILILTMAHLCSLHLHRQIFNYGSYILDVTGPLMIMVQKISIVGFGYSDGFSKDEELSPLHKQHKITGCPSLLAYMSYLFSFLTLMTGPCFFFQDYIQFIEGNSFKPYSVQNSQGKSHVKYPSNFMPFLISFLSVLFWGFVTVKITSQFPVNYLIEPTVLNESWFLAKLVYAYLCTTLYRAQYYVAWKFGEAVSHAAGFGFSGWTKEGLDTWDLVSNCKVIELETGTSLKVLIDSWNVQTSNWLRYIVYTRFKYNPTIATFTLSAMWHGFYPGYYVTFVGGAIALIVSKKFRKLYRHNFLSPPYVKFLYDVFTWIVAHATLSFLIVAFLLLRISLIIKFYKSVYFYMPIITLLLIAFLPNPKEHKK